MQAINAAEYQADNHYRKFNMTAIGHLTGTQMEI